MLTSAALIPTNDIKMHNLLMILLLNFHPVFEATILVFLCAESSNSDMPMMWIFPYFFEPRILECLPSFAMLDYQVNWQYITFRH